MSTFKLICIGIAVVLVLALILFACDVDKWLDNSVVTFIPYLTVKNYLLFHHVVYNGEAYYMLDSEYDLPDKVVPFSEKVTVILVDEDGDAYDPEREEEAYLYKNDEDKMYLYFDSAKYTKDKSKALKALGLSDE